MIWPAVVQREVDALTAAGVVAVTDPRSVSAPCVLLRPRSVTAGGGCVMEVEVEVVAVAPGPEHGDSWAWLFNTAAPALAPLIGGVLTIDDYEDMPALVGTFSRGA
jgi:hypothetical protein